MKKLQRLSIITINLNNLSGLRNTVESVFSQSFTDFEYIIIDGGSTDGSKEFLKEQDGKFAYCLSEQDEGVYQAMNKGIIAAKGDYIHFLNSGDTYFSEDTLINVFKNPHQEEILCGNVLNYTEESEWIIAPPEKLTYLHLREHNLPHQGCFIKKDLFDKAGLYNERFKIASDWEFNLKVFAFHGASYKRIDETIVKYPFDGISSKIENRTALMKEKEDIIKGNFSFFENDYKELVSYKSAWQKYHRSRAHRQLDKIINSKLYRLFK